MPSETRRAGLSRPSPTESASASRPKAHQAAGQEFGLTTLSRGGELAIFLKHDVRTLQRCIGNRAVQRVFGALARDLKHSKAQRSATAGSPAIQRLDAIKPDILNVVGEDHKQTATGTKRNRDHEKAYTRDVAKGDYWTEQQFLDKNKKAGDPIHLRVAYTVRHISNQLFADQIGNQGYLKHIDQGFLQSLPKTVDILKTSILDADSGFAKTTAPGIVDRLSQTLPASGQYDSQTLQDLQQIVRDLTAIVKPHGDIRVIRNDRSLAMSEAARVLAFELEGVWKIGSNHYDDIEAARDAGSIGFNYNLVPGDAFDKDLAEWLKRQAPPAPEGAAAPGRPPESGGFFQGFKKKLFGK